MKGVTMVKKLTITLSETGAVNVEGPLAEKLLCYGLLEIARDSIKAFNDKRETAGPELYVAHGQFPPNGN